MTTENNNKNNKWKFNIMYECTSVSMNEHHDVSMYVCTIQQ